MDFLGGIPSIVCKLSNPPLGSTCLFWWKDMQPWSLTLPPQKKIMVGRPLTLWDGTFFGGYIKISGSNPTNYFFLVDWRGDLPNTSQQNDSMMKIKEKYLLVWGGVAKGTFRSTSDIGSKSYHWCLSLGIRTWFWRFFLVTFKLLDLQPVRLMVQKSCTTWDV